MLFHGLLRFFRGGGMRPIAAVALFATLFVAVPSERTESNIVLASNADQPRYVDMLCDNWGVVFYLTAPTQASPTVTNYEYAYSTTQIIAEPADGSFRAISPADATSPVDVSWDTLGLPNGVVHYFTFEQCSILAPRVRVGGMSRVRPVTQVVR